ncbi:acyl-CoA dehydrogenase family protein [Streptomyces sp. NPDC003077]|uniref:acyl-CoA dehydrogenase family protein n=1 Tax=Streptomyces sp. NPDC003077 TaxID=3154443 RepID=UPI0033BADA10
MRESATVGEAGLRAAVRELFDAPFVREELARVWAVRDDECPHPAAVYQALGARRWLAPHWPRHYGGLGLSAYASAVVAEEMGLHGIPDSVRVNTIDNAGATLLKAGTPEQRARFLPGMARGETVFAVLYTEPDVGSDLGGMSTRAVPVPGGWRVDGTKEWNARTGLAEFGVLAARTGGGGDGGDGGGGKKFAGIGLFVLPLHVPGVVVEPLGTLNHERLYRVRLSDVRLPGDALVGRPGQGWSLVTEALGLERTGVNYAGKARRWFDRMTAELAARGLLADACRDHGLRRLDAEIEAARLLAWRAVRDVELGRRNAAAAAGAKWWTSELAQRVAWLAWRLLGPLAASPRHPSTGFPDLVPAVREAPGLTLAAGTSEVLLTTVATDLLDGSDPWEAP